MWETAMVMHREQTEVDLELIDFSSNSFPIMRRCFHFNIMKLAIVIRSNLNSTNCFKGIMDLHSGISCFVT